MTDQGIVDLPSQPVDSRLERRVHETGPALPGPNGPGSRPARALLGWLPPEQGEFLLVSNRSGTELTGAESDRARQAREAVAARAAGIDQAGLVSALPPELAGHVARLKATPFGSQMFTEGWEIVMVDLSRVVAFQPTVFVDTAVERVADVDPSDLTAIAEMTLPIDRTAPITTQYDQNKKAYVLYSPDPNLQVAGPMQSPPGAPPMFGFAVTVANSAVQVVSYQGRYVLRDGYHRAYGFLGRGITHAPAFVRNFDTDGDPAPLGMLSRAAWLGERPPLLSDYHDDAVAEELRLPARGKMILIQAIELAAPC